MRTKAEIQNDLDNVEMELRSLMDAVKDTSKEINLEEVRTKKDEFVAKRTSLTKELAECDKPQGAEKMENKESMISNRSFLRAAEEMRSITIKQTGTINQVKDLFETVDDTDDILSAVSYDYGPNASTNIPVLEPGLAEPSEYDEGAASITEDSSADLKTTEIQPKCVASILPVTAETLLMGSVNIEAKMPELFRKVFRRKMHQGLISGSGTGKSMKGIFVSAKDNAAGQTKIAGTSIKCSELAGLALKVGRKDENFEIVMNPSVYQGILSDSTDGEDVKLYKEGLIRAKEIEGVKIRLDPLAPVATSTGSVLAVAVPLSRYHIGVASEVVVTPVKVKGDTKTYFQAEAFFSGKQVTDSDLFSLAVK